MSTRTKPRNLLTLKQALEQAEKAQCALGSFSPRSTPMIQAILLGGQKMQSPLIVQISQKELDRYTISPAEFADEFYKQLQDQQITVPVVLHLDHTKKIEVIQDA